MADINQSCEIIALTNCAAVIGSSCTSAVRVLHRLLDTREMPATPAYVCVDVKDCALCHVLAAAGQRYLTVGASFYYPQVAEMSACCSRESRTDCHPAGRRLHTTLIRHKRVEQDLGIKWTPLEDIIRVGLQQLLDLERRQASATS
ncbi:hypothetical protein P389DRAFT_182274 [Cystobasidium minutum MCA 4210]|uniref:uncharacterized protein n=1 Tax=Cystobasidium minutum MCA 4210 TaxID=1397322 RepID=UPI0034CD3766|eukprot:jgi/Rhomi1/182274/fgenesh1_pg.12_\